MTEKRYKESYTIHSYEVDASLKAHLATIGNYLQDTAGRHAKILKFGYEDLLKNNQFWALSRLKIEMFQYPGWNERIWIETWPSGIHKLFAYRDFRIRTDTGKTIGEASSAWLVVDMKNRRPQNPEFLYRLVPDLTVTQPGSSLEKLPAVTGNGTDTHHTVRYSDLDQNNHLNNVKYIQWILDSYPMDFHKHKRVKIFEINFLSESSYGEEIRMRIEKKNDPSNIFQHSLTRLRDDKEICRVRITWHDPV